VFTGAIFAILIYLLHLSVVVSKLQEQNKTLAQEMALLREEIRKKKEA
jgi:predicted ATP-grasp superfamily ATP-dependent carboligase